MISALSSRVAPESPDAFLSAGNNSMRFHSLLSSIFVAAICASLAVAQSDGFADRSPRYLLQPSDVLEIHYRYSPEFDQTVTVQPDGFVSLQLAGDLQLRNLTVGQAKTAILEKVSQRLKDPEITLVLKEFEKPYFIVGGEVNTPGRFEMRGSMTALEAIAMAGGFKSASAKHSQVILYRRVGSDMAKAEILDLKASMNPKSSEALADLHSGDLLVVPQNNVSKIERYVKWVSVSIYPPIP
jgi:polysaccharide biosynthesis/export protein